MKESVLQRRVWLISQCQLTSQDRNRLFCTRTLLPGLGPSGRKPASLQAFTPSCLAVPTERSLKPSCFKAPPSSQEQPTGNESKGRQPQVRRQSLVCHGGTGGTARRDLLSIPGIHDEAVRFTYVELCPINSTVPGPGPARVGGGSVSRPEVMDHDLFQGLRARV